MRRRVAVDWSRRASRWSHSAISSSTSETMRCCSARDGMGTGNSAHLPLLMIGNVPVPDSYLYDSWPALRLCKMKNARMRISFLGHWRRGGSS